MSKREEKLLSLDQYFTVSEAAEYLGVSASTLRNWDNCGKVEAVRHPVNGYRLYNKEALDGLLTVVSQGKTND